LYANARFERRPQQDLVHAVEVLRQVSGAQRRLRQSNKVGLGNTRDIAAHAHLQQPMCASAKDDVETPWPITLGG
jgi:hypothetical protein